MTTRNFGSILFLIIFLNSRISLGYSQQSIFQDFNSPLGPSNNSPLRGVGNGPIMPINSFNGGGGGGLSGGGFNRGVGFGGRAQIHPYIPINQAQQQQFFHRAAPVQNEFLMQSPQHNQRHFPLRPYGPSIHPFSNVGAIGPNQQQSVFFGQNNNNNNPNNIPLEIVHGRQINHISGGSGNGAIPQGPFGAMDFAPPRVAGVAAFQNDASVDSGKDSQLPNWRGQVSPMDEPRNPVSETAGSELPKFLHGSPKEIVDEYKRIIRTPNSNYASQVSEIENLVVRKLDSEHQELYKKFMQENDDREQKHRDRIHSTISQMSDKAQEQFAKISTILRNPNVADSDRWERVMKLYGQMQPDLRNEFEQKFKGFGTIDSPNQSL